MKVIIAGGRNFGNYELLKSACDTAFGNLHIEIVSGGAKGADELGVKYAYEKGLDVKIIQADWQRYGRKAGPIRNKEMADYADTLIAFWDGQSRGTKNMIETARSQNLNVIVVGY
jgi:hypothetical protein